MSKNYYNQCTLSRRIGKCHCIITSWIPSKFAILNNVLKIKNNDIWENGWVVEFVGSKLEEQYLPDYRKAIRKHRDKTGDSLPKNDRK